jgi:hypothetical protein
MRLRRRVKTFSMRLECIVVAAKLLAPPAGLFTRHVSRFFTSAGHLPGRAGRFCVVAGRLRRDLGRLDAPTGRLLSRAGHFARRAGRFTVHAGRFSRRLGSAPSDVLHEARPHREKRPARSHDPQLHRARSSASTRNPRLSCTASPQKSSAGTDADARVASGSKRRVHAFVTDSRVDGCGIFAEPFGSRLDALSRDAPAQLDSHLVETRRLLATRATQKKKRMVNLGIVG